MADGDARIEWTDMLQLLTPVAPRRGPVPRAGSIHLRRPDEENGKARTMILRQGQRMEIGLVRERRKVGRVENLVNADHEITSWYHAAGRHDHQDWRRPQSSRMPPLASMLTARQGGG